MDIRSIKSTDAIKVVQIRDDQFHEMIYRILKTEEKLVNLEDKFNKLKASKESPYFNTAEAMKYLKIKSRTTFGALVDAGKIKIHGYSTPGRQLFLKDDLDSYVLNDNIKRAA